MTAPNPDGVINHNISAPSASENERESRFALQSHTNKPDSAPRDLEIGAAPPKPAHAASDEDSSSSSSGTSSSSSDSDGQHHTKKSRGGRKQKQQEKKCSASTVVIITAAVLVLCLIGAACFGTFDDFLFARSIHPSFILKSK